MFIVNAKLRAVDIWNIVPIGQSCVLDPDFLGFLFTCINATFVK